MLRNLQGNILKGHGRDHTVHIFLEFQQTWHNQWGQANPTTKFSFGQFVTLKGGEFFFAPCLPFLDALTTP